jgi:hypothetical protein
MTRGCGDLRSENLVDVRAARFDVFGFDPGASQQFGNFFRIFWKIDKFAQPVKGEFHVWGAHAPGVLFSAPSPETSSRRRVVPTFDEHLARTPNAARETRALPR